MSSENNGELTKGQKYKIDISGSYARLFCTEDGLAVLYDLMDKGFIMKPTCQNVVREGDALRNEGKRELVLHIFEMMETDYPKLFKRIKDAEKQQEEYYGF